MSGAGANAARIADYTRLQPDSDSRLSAARHGDAVCSPVVPGWQGVQSNGGQAYTSTVAGVSEETGSGNPSGSHATSDCRQLRHPQTRESKIVDSVAQSTSAENI